MEPSRSLDFTPISSEVPFFAAYFK